MFRGSIRHNICLGAVCDEAKLQRAVWVACLAEDLKTLEHGLQTDVGAKGSNLSGGQKARVSIARVLYHVADNDVLLLDDVFAALDEQTFKLLVQRMFTSASIPVSVTVVLTCARGLVCPQPLRSVSICDGTVTLHSSSQSVFEGSPVAASLPSPRLTSLCNPSSPWPELGFSSQPDHGLKQLLEQLELDSQLPQHTLSRDAGSGGAADGRLLQDTDRLTQLVDWSNLAV